MMHQILERLAQFGGEGALGLLFVLSIVNLGIISQRVWFFARCHINADTFVKQLVALLRVRDVRRAEALSQQANASICVVTLAGLLQADEGALVVEQAMQTATSHERIHLEDKLVLLNELARLSLLVGVLGSLFDVVALGSQIATISTSEGTAGPLAPSAMLAAITPMIGGLLVAIPAWLARSMLNVHVQRALRQCDFVARLVPSQLAVGQSASPTSSVRPLQVQRVAA
jgi:biopolymer transport protein ExbB/TolQ